MFFYTSKLFWMFFAPLNLVLILMVTGFVLSFVFKKTGKTLLALGFLLFIGLGVFPVGSNMLAFLENQYERPVEQPEKIDGVIILGGIFDPAISQSRDHGAIGEGIERVIDALEISKKYPNSIIVFSGGDGTLDNNNHPEALDIEDFLNKIDYPQDKVFYEDQSRNTYENAKLTRQLMQPIPEEHWVLVTSAYHMPRALAAFHSQGWHNVIPYPTDYRTTGKVTWLPDRLNVSGNIRAADLALHEYIGFIVYNVTGKISSHLR